MIGKFAIVLVLALVVGLGVAMPAFASSSVEATANPALSALITKNMNMPEGVSVPAGGLSFTFAFERAGYNDGPSPSGAAHPNLSETTLTVAAGETSATTNILPALVAAANSSSEINAGPHDWIVTELAGSSGTTGVAYDATQWLLRAHFANPVAPLTEMTVNYVEVFAVSGALGNLDIGTKQGAGMQFTNVFVPSIGDSTNPALFFSKTIGEANRHNANLNTLFSFTATLTASAPLESGSTTVTPELPSPLVGTIVMSDGNTPAPTTVNGVARETSIPFINGAASFQLRDGERLIFPTLPAGTSYVITEAAAETFRPAASVLQGAGTAVEFAPDVLPGYGSSLTANGLVSNALVNSVFNNSAAFTNTLQTITPTGLVIGANIALVAAALAVAALMLVMSSRNRRRIEELPVV